MATDLEAEILAILRKMKADDRPASFADLARRFGATPNLIASCARQMIDKGIAEPAMVTNRGVETLHGLMPQPVVPTA
jgi:transposase-like protein